MINEKSDFPQSHRLCDGRVNASVQFNDGIKFRNLNENAYKRDGRDLFLGRLFIGETSIGFFNFQVRVQFFDDLIKRSHRLELFVASGKRQCREFVFHIIQFPQIHAGSASRMNVIRQII